MAYNILGINPFHDGSVCLISDGKIVSYIEEERLTRIKKDSNPFFAIQNFYSKYKINDIVLGGLNHQKGELSYTLEDPIVGFLKKLMYSLSHIENPPSIYDLSDSHHYLHAHASFHNSGYNKALGVIIDGGGSRNLKTKLEEAISVLTWDNSKIKFIKGIYRNFQNNTPQLNIANFYSAITYYLGFKGNQEGKTMGLSSYGNSKEIKNQNYFNNGLLDNSFGFIDKKSLGLENYFKLNPSIFPPITNFEWHTDSSKLNQKISNLALEIQNECQKNVGDIIEKYINKTGLKNVVCSGGYFLNCVSNYYLKKRFPNINFYFEPLSHDGGTAIGAALFRWYKLNPNSKPYKQRTLYYGPQYSKEQLLEGIKKYV